MGEVYRARDTRLGREVALKMVSEALGADPELLERFEREARLGGSLNHPNVVALYDVGVQEGTPFLVTELLKGETLRARLERGRLPLATALDIAAQLASGLAAAHERGIAHRDLKPENVFLTRDGRAKLLDFGIAKAVEAALEPAPHGMLERTAAPGGGTRAGAVFGSPGYMSPEQVRGDAADARTDFFSFGAVLHEMLSGRRAFPGPLGESGQSILHDAPPELPASVPEPVVQVVERCLEKDPDRRFHSAGDLAFHLESLRSASARREAARSTQTRSRRWALALVVALAAAGAVLVLLRRPAPVSGSPRVQQLTFLRGEVVTARFTPDGRNVFFTGSGVGEPMHVYSTTLDRPDYHLVPLDAAELLAISSRGDLAVALHPVWRLFEDGGRGMLATMPMVGGAPRELLDQVGYADWAPDGASLAVVHQVQSSSRLEFPIGRVLYESGGWLSHPRVSPRGDRVAFIDHPSLYDYPGELMVVDGSGHARVLARSTAQIGGVAWSPDGREIWFTRDDEPPMSLWAVRADGGDVRLVYRGTSDLILQDIAADGRVLAVSFERRSKISVTRPGTEQPIQELSWLDQSVLDDISADGSTVLFSENDRIANLRKTDGSAPVHLADAKGLGLSPDGKWVLAIRAHETPESHQLLVLPTGAGLAKSLELSGLRLIRRARFAPDGRHVAVIARAEDSPGFAVHWVDRETGQRRAITPPDLEGYFLEVSPDGGTVASIGRGGALTLYPVAGGPPVVLSELGEPWAPAGWDSSGNLFARRLYEIPARVFSIDVRTGNRRPFATIAPPDATGADWMYRLKVSTNGTSIGFSYSVRQGKALLLSWGEPQPRQ
jgi:dipeptidyl aminopeptidase/acylaminoacyl peptidase